MMFLQYVFILKPPNYIPSESQDLSLSLLSQAGAINFVTRTGRFLVSSDYRLTPDEEQHIREKYSE